MSEPLQAVLYPWLQPTANWLGERRASLPHALLICGPAGIGKSGFAHFLAQALLCDQAGADLQTCGHCQNCRLLSTGSHPDLYLIHPVEEGKSILVDQVRALGEFIFLRPHAAQGRVVLISPAAAMNLNAANSLLKILEEPPAGSHLILVTDQPSRLAATVRSRCSRVNLPAPAQDVALNWLKAQPQAPAQADLLLKLADGAPLRALMLAQTDFLAQRETLKRDLQALTSREADPLSCAARWKGIGASRCLNWLQTWLGDLAKVALSPAHPQLANPDAQAELHGLQKQLNLKQLFKFHDLVSESRRLVEGPLDELLLLEDILIRWTRLVRH